MPNNALTFAELRDFDEKRLFIKIVPFLLTYTRFERIGGSDLQSRQQIWRITVNNSERIDCYYPWTSLYTSSLLRL
jgi:hypothetical protein